MPHCFNVVHPKPRTKQDFFFTQWQCQMPDEPFHNLGALKSAARCSWGDWKVSELESSESIFCPFWAKLESVRIGKCQNWKVSESESVRIRECQNWKVSETAQFESVRIRECQNWKVSETAQFESVRIGKCQNLLGLESVRSCSDWKVSEIAWIGKCQKLPPKHLYTSNISSNIWFVGSDTKSRRVLFAICINLWDIFFCSLTTVANKVAASWRARNLNCDAEAHKGYGLIEASLYYINRYALSN